ncbi:hypothetical protein AALP_AA1G298100 [Arabis alpina]|uniref:DUF295 domain-containing protein n=1 Tax=Arabis alpina TaxID=50452 RepID=A0A087HRJ8_ARAAL|nr:hypothetical protein AALP_AA1G298100 [Arabis alpina]
MSRNFIRHFKLSPWNHTLIKNRNFRLFSSSITTPPYLTLGTTLKNDLPDGSNIRNLLLFDPTKEEMLTVSDKTLPEELVGTEHLVESASSKERFLVKWYAQRFFPLSHEGVSYTTRRFMVFREEERTEGKCHGFGIYNIDDTTVHHFQAPEGAPACFTDPYWLPPFRTCIEPIY